MQDRSDVCVFSILWPAQTLNKRDLFSFSLVAVRLETKGEIVSHKSLEKAQCVHACVCAEYIDMTVLNFTR